MRRILFLEDEPTIREVLAEYMKMQRYEVTEACDGDEAVALLKSQNFDLAVLDIIVPKKKRAGSPCLYSAGVSGYGRHHADSPGR